MLLYRHECNVETFSFASAWQVSVYSCSHDCKLRIMPSYFSVDQSASTIRRFLIVSSYYFVVLVHITQQYVETFSQ